MSIFFLQYCIQNQNNFYETYLYFIRDAFDVFGSICRKVFKGKNYLTEWKIMKGLPSFPEGPNPIPIRFKADEKSKVESINCDSIKTII
jgi:hypothetical protein